jgi:hypothetical protein
MKRMHESFEEYIMIKSSEIEILHKTFFENLIIVYRTFSILLLHPDVHYNIYKRHPYTKPVKFKPNSRTLFTLTVI